MSVVKPVRQPNASYYDLGAILDFEAANPSIANGRKELRIRRVFQTSAVRYYYRLDQILDTPAALEHAPVLVHRLLDQRAERARRRAGRTVQTFFERNRS